MSQDISKLGGGSGGGAPDPARPPCAKNTDEHRVDGTYAIIANQVEVRAEPPQVPAPIDPCKILLLASNPTALQGEVNLRGDKGVRITTGPMSLPPRPAVEDSAIMGLEVETFDLHSITLTRGVTQPNIQKIEMKPTGITIEGNPMPITMHSKQTIQLNSLLKIDLLVGEGPATSEVTLVPGKISLSIGPSTITMDPQQIKIAVASNSITISPQGITIQGLPAVNIN
jgi:hypothetical protein